MFSALCSAQLVLDKFIIIITIPIHFDLIITCNNNGMAHPPLRAHAIVVFQSNTLFSIILQYNWRELNLIWFGQCDDSNRNRLWSGRWLPPNNFWMTIGTWMHFNWNSTSEIESPQINMHTTCEWIQIIASKFH